MCAACWKVVSLTELQGEVEVSLGSIRRNHEVTYKANPAILSTHGRQQLTYCLLEANKAMFADLAASKTSPSDLSTLCNAGKIPLLPWRFFCTPIGPLGPARGIFRLVPLGPHYKTDRRGQKRVRIPLLPRKGPGHAC